ncbi:MAG: LlaMI family restriction endonuclease [Candidatus Pacebacteria bacterium]|nr:LlaMI family restriction endonuclease [Candidatus Paceibacterota bacterium]
MTNTQNREETKRKIITLFDKKVRGKKSDTTSSNAGHDGKDGHWLETQMGIAHNGNNAPDIDGFEMKNHTASKTTFGDWSPDYSLFKKKVNILKRDQFLQFFGAPNVEKENRYSWSGKPCPKINTYNDFGQKLEIDEYDNILTIYSFEKDKRLDKNNIVPKDLQQNRLIIASWSAELMKKRVEKKFNKLGWFKCNKNSEGVYTSIVFGDPINFKTWITGVKKGLIFFDSGMYAGNPRPYSQWRANNNYWESLITDTH